MILAVGTRRKQSNRPETVLLSGMDGSLGKIPSQMLGDKCQPQGQKLTLVSLDPSKSGVKVQLPHPHRAPQSTMSTMSMSSPGVTLTVSPNPQLGMKSRSLTSAPGSRLEVHDPKTKTVILTSPCIKWIKSGQNLKVINLPLGLVPSLNVCRLPNAKGIVISRPTNLNQIIIHKEAPVQRRPESLHRNPGLPVPWRGQVTPIVFSAAPSPVVLSISQAAGTSSTGGGTGVREAVASLPINNGYSRGVYENFRKWQQYKGLVRKHFALTPDTEAVACFFIPVLRSLSQFKPQLSTEEGIPLAVQEWRKLSNFDRMIYYEMAEKFMEFELEEQAQQLQCEQVPVQSGLSQGVQILSGVTGKSNKQILEDPGGKKCNSKGTSQRSHKQAKVAPQAGSTSGPRQLPIPIEAINQYIGIMEALTEDQQMEGEAFPEPIEDQGNEEPELIKYIEKLCSKDCFISKAEAIIHPEFLSNLLSPNGNMDFPRLIKELEMEEHLSAAELERRRDTTQEENFWQTEASDPRPPTDYRPRALSPSTLPSEAARPLQGLLLPPLDGPCPYSSRLQRLALQSASDRASPTEAPATLVSAAEAPAPRLQQARHVLLHELQGKASPRGLAEVGQPQARNLSPGPELQAAGIERASHNPMPPGATVGEPASPAEQEEEEEEEAPGVPAPEAQPQPQQQASAPGLAQPQASPGLHAPASSQLPGDAPPVQLPFLDAGDAHCPAWGPRDGRDLGEGPSSTAKAQGEACPVRPDPSTPYRGPTDAPRPLRSSKKLPAVKPAATASLSRVRTRQQKRSSSGTTVRRSKRVKKN